jgi:hypothetical protein
MPTLRGASHYGPGASRGQGRSLLIPKIPCPFLPISTSKMLIISKKSPKLKKIKKMLKFQLHKDYDLSGLLK